MSDAGTSFSPQETACLRPSVATPSNPVRCRRQIERVRTGLVPIVNKQQGFASYHAFDAGDNVAVSVSFYQTRAAADAANKEAATWVESHLGQLLTPLDVSTGEVLVEAHALALV